MSLCVQPPTPTRSAVGTGLTGHNLGVDTSAWSPAQRRAAPLGKGRCQMRPGARRLGNPQHSQDGHCPRSRVLLSSATARLTGQRPLGPISELPTAGSAGKPAVFAAKFNWGTKGEAPQNIVLSVPTGTAGRTVPKFTLQTTIGGTSPRLPLLVTPGEPWAAPRAHLKPPPRSTSPLPCHLDNSVPGPKLLSALPLLPRPHCGVRVGSWTRMAFRWPWASHPGTLREQWDSSKNRASLNLPTGQTGVMEALK